MEEVERKVLRLGDQRNQIVSDKIGLRQEFLKERDEIKALVKRRFRFKFQDIKYEFIDDNSKRFIKIEGLRRRVNGFKAHLYKLGKGLMGKNIFSYNKAEDWILERQRKSRRKQKFTFRLETPISDYERKVCVETQSPIDRADKKGSIR